LFALDMVLDAIGLGRGYRMRRYAMPGLGLLVLGAAIGAGIGLVLAPSSGRRLRENVADQLRRTKGAIADAKAQVGPS
jgi:hypothetical protein